MKNVTLIIGMVLLLFGCGDRNSSSNAKENKNLKEVVIERYSAGDKKIVGFYDGEGSNEVIIKRVHYYSQNDGGGKEKEENYKNGKLEGKYYEWYAKGNKKVDSNYKNGKLEGKSYNWSSYQSFYDFNYKNGKLHDTCKRYNASGDLWVVGLFKDGHGIEWKEYRDGQLMEHIEFNWDGATTNVIKGKGYNSWAYDSYFCVN